jgi:uncharacterized phage-associated protein
MANVHDVAARVLELCGRVNAMKLQKLVYYSQVWHVVWHDEPMFENPIEAWANGPVVYDLFDRHRGRFTLDEWPWGDSSRLDDDERETIDIVMKYYGGMTGERLSRLTHSERPWIEARQGLEPTERSRREIPLDEIADFYGTLAASDAGTRVDQIDWEIF